MSKFLACSTVLLALISTTVAAQEANGCVDIKKNHDDYRIDLPYLPTGTPLLGRFGFAFGDGIDHHIGIIAIDPFFPPGTMRLVFGDEKPDEGDDNYCYNVTHFDFSDPRIQQVNRGLDICSEAGKCTVQLDKPVGDFVFVLVGFDLEFRATDHHLKEIEFLENEGALTVAFNDEHFDPADDTFLWRVQYAYVPRDLFSDVGELSGHNAHDRVLGQMLPGQAVLRGFRFDFTNGDHHIQQISVRPDTTGTAFLTYRDVNGDDPFDFTYQWAILCPQVLGENCMSHGTQ